MSATNRSLVELFLAGAPTEDLKATQWLLSQRGYRALCEADLPNYQRNGKPDTRSRGAARMVAMLNCRAVVVHDAMSAAEQHLVRTVCHYTGQRMVQLEELPLYASDVSTDRLNELDLVLQSDGPAMKERALALLATVKAHLLGFERAFNARAGWFFTNGQKQQPTPKPYPVLDDQPTVTA